MPNSQDILVKFPIGHLFFVLTTGLFVFLSLPYDFFDTDFFNILKNIPDYTNVFDFFGENFSPFTNVSYLNTEKTIVLTKIFFVIIIVGVFFLLISSFFPLFNHLLKRACSETIRIIRRKQKIQHTPEEKKQQADNQKEERFFEINLAKWSRDKGYKPYLDYKRSINDIATGLFYASEFSLLLILVVAIPVYFHSWEMFSNSWFGMLIFSVISTFFSWIIKRVNETTLEKFLDPFKELCKKEEAKKL